MVNLLAQLKYFENDQTIYLTCDQQCSTQIIKNALIDFMNQVCLIEETAKAHELQKEDVLEKIQELDQCPTHSE